MLHSNQTTNKSKPKELVYIKFSINQVHVHNKTCDDILNDPNASSTDKAVALQIKQDMAHKRPTDYHCIWYVGETVRTLDQRMKEDYPLILRRFGVTHKFQIAQAPAETEYCSAKFFTLLLESAVGGCIQEATNLTLELSAKEEEEEFVRLAYYHMSCVNAIHAGWTGYMKVDGTALNLFMARNCKGNESTPVREVTSNPAVMSYIARNKIAIAIANDIEDADETYEPTMMEFCKFWGKMMFDKKLGIFNKNHPVLLLAGVDNWGAYAMLEKNDEGKSVHAVKLGTISMLKKNDEGKPVRSVNMHEARSQKKLKDGATKMELYCAQCSNPR